jgi:CO dehydrogenase/acetyl-CoA synthase gamma subunit (corrinoid Fe-S protein)
MEVQPTDSPAEPNFDKLVKHLGNATRLLIDCGDELVENILSEKIDLIKKFATDAACRALMVERMVKGETGDDTEEFSWNISTDVRYGKL